MPLQFRVGMPDLKAVGGTDYSFEPHLMAHLLRLRERVSKLRDQVGRLEAEFAPRLRQIFRIKNIYETNAIEGSALTLGETELVVREGLTITGKPLEDTLAAKNLATALDFFEELARRNAPIRATDIRSIHQAVLTGIDDANAGSYRTVAVQISGSRYETPPPEKVHGMMRDFTDWLSLITDPSYRSDEDVLVLACAAHAWFVYIHPFVDGNGRTARLIMNLILIRHGYPLTIITKDERERYYDALEESQAGNLTPFIALVLEAADESMAIYEQAAQEQTDLAHFAERIVQAQTAQASNDYNIFVAAMGLLKNYFTEAVELIRNRQQAAGLAPSISLREFSVLDFEKFQRLKMQEPTKQTWFFRMDFQQGGEPTTQRYIFFFGYSSVGMTNHAGMTVTLHISAEVAPFQYKRLSELRDARYPDIYEIAYLAREERFVALHNGGTPETLRAEEIARDFIEQALK